MRKRILTSLIIVTVLILVLMGVFYATGIFKTDIHYGPRLGVRTPFPIIEYRTFGDYPEPNEWNVLGIAANIILLFFSVLLLISIKSINEWYKNIKSSNRIGVLIAAFFILLFLIALWIKFGMKSFI